MNNYSIFSPLKTAKIITESLKSLPKNWVLTPLREKKPYRKDWQNENPVSLDIIEQGILKGNLNTSKKGKQYLAFDSGIGLRTGDISGGLLALDIDGLSGAEIGMHIEGYEPLPKTVSWTSGKQGREQRLFQIPNQYRQQFKSFNRLALSELNGFKCAEGEQLEFRYNGCQSVLPPSYHPETGSYKWIKSPEHYPIADLPQWLINFLLTQINPQSEIINENTMNPYERYLSEITLPIAENIPLDAVVAPKTRDLLSGVGQGQRDNTGALIARDLIGTANYLDSIGQNYTQSPYELLSEFCTRCTPPLSAKDCERIYRSAMKANPQPSLDTDKINGCISAWYWNNSDIKKAYVKEKVTAVAIPESKEKITLSKWEAVEKAREVLLGDHDEIKTNILLEDIRKSTDISEYSWDNKYIKPLKREIKQQKLRLEIAVYCQETDVYEKIQLKQKICSNYSLNNFDFQILVDYTEQQQTTPQKTQFSFREFANLATIQENWLIPSFLPVGEMLMLTALPKVGKTLLANDIAYAVLSGGEILGEKAKQGKVLYISSDETAGSLIRRFQSRGFDLLPEADENLRIMTHLDLSNMGTLESELEDFKPDLVVIDSLTSITLDLNISEKDSEFAKYGYKLKDLLKKYNAASILIHHENKNSEQKGICKVSGSARIVAVPWGIAQLSGGEVIGDGDDKELVKGQNIRWLDLQPREGEKIKYTLEINPKDTWSQEGIFNFLGEYDDPHGDKKTQGELVIQLLRQEKAPLEYSEINNHLNLGRGLYVILDRLCDRKLINRQRSKNNPRRWVYFIESNSQETNCKEILTDEKNSLTPLPLSHTSEVVDSNSTTNMDKEKQVSQQVSQQLVNTTKSVDKEVNTSNQDMVSDEAVSQHFSEKQGRGGSTEPVELKKEPETNCEQGHVIEIDFMAIAREIKQVLFSLGNDTKERRKQAMKEITGLDKNFVDYTDEELLTAYEKVKKLKKDW
ncbi:AAA family ATPase [Cyanobacterium aponinum UTEX 3222]|uniref:AAA family ATPase n=1 Tax=Cyanobacterium aponinum TaxID=379064 RepID=UPI003093264C|nr:AAA family ATPase [Cyanobacterium aponinum UTEX 3222]